MARSNAVSERRRPTGSVHHTRGSAALLTIVVAASACSGGPGTGPSSIVTSRPASTSTIALETVEAPTAAAAGCELLRGWVNAGVEEINQASAQAAEALSPTDVRHAFLDALDGVESILREWPTRVEAGIPGKSQTVTAFRTDLSSRSSDALEVLEGMRSRVEEWPDDDTETRNARTQQAFIWFEGVMAEMKPDLGPYEGSPLGDELATAAACELTIRR